MQIQFDILTFYSTLNTSVFNLAFVQILMYFGVASFEQFFHQFKWSHLGSDIPSIIVIY